MIELYLTRTLALEEATFGVLFSGRQPVCVTLELPWNDNRTDESCIPVGAYRVVPYSSERYPNVWHVLDVPGRTHILIHSGNYPSNTNGCIIPGSQYGLGDNALAVSSSGAAMQKIRQIVKQEDFILHINEKGAINFR